MYSGIDLIWGKEFQICIFITEYRVNIQQVVMYEIFAPLNVKIIEQVNTLYQVNNHVSIEMAIQSQTFSNVKAKSRAFNKTILLGKWK